MRWELILKAIKLLGFGNHFCSLISARLTLVTYVKIIPSRGLRQSYPLSPYSFVIGAEVLSRLLMRGESLNGFHGIKISKNSATINHLLLSCRAKQEELHNLMVVLHKCTLWSSHSTNHENLAYFFFFKEYI